MQLEINSKWANIATLIKMIISDPDGNALATLLTVVTLVIIQFSRFTLLSFLLYSIAVNVIVITERNKHGDGCSLTS